MHRLNPRPLTAEAFAPYGAVIAARGDGELINQGTSLKFANLCKVELDAGAEAALHLYRPQPTKLPCELSVLERHPLASQAFIPLGQTTFLVVVCGSAEKAQPGDLRAFFTKGAQGVQFATGVWHHPLLAMDAREFLIVDRFCADQISRDRNLDLINVQHWHCELLAPPARVHGPNT